MRVYRGGDGREMISVGEGRSVSRQYYEANRHLFGGERTNPASPSTGDRHAANGDAGDSRSISSKLVRSEDGARPRHEGQKQKAAGEAQSSPAATSPQENTGKRGRRRGMGPSAVHIKTLELYATKDISYAAIGTKAGAPSGSVGVWIADGRKRRDPRVIAGDRLRGKAPR